MNTKSEISLMKSHLDQDFVTSYDEWCWLMDYVLEILQKALFFFLVEK